MEQQNKSQELMAETPQTEAPAPEVSVRPRAGIGRAGRIMLVFAFLIPFV